MRAVLQRVLRASVSVDGQVVGALAGRGLVALVGVATDDDGRDAALVARKIAELRIFDGEVGGAEVSVGDVGGGVLVISQFTLLADTRRGRRPSWSGAAPGAVAQPLVEAVVAYLRGRGLAVATGVFGADMAVELINDGPFTIVLDTAQERSDQQRGNRGGGHRGP